MGWQDTIDGEEAIVSGVDFDIKTTIDSPLKVVSEKEILKVIPKGTKISILLI